MVLIELEFCPLKALKTLNVFGMLVSVQEVAVSSQVKYSGSLELTGLIQFNQKTCGNGYHR